MAMASSSSASAPPSKPSMPRNVRAMAWDASCPYRLFLTSNKTLTPIFSHDGVGCNAYERACLMQLLLQSSSEDSHQNDTTKYQSQLYRRALLKCLTTWQQEGEQSSSANLELLKVVNNVTHLTEICMLSSNAQDEPGSITADMVRYLRHHYLEAPDDNLQDDLIGGASSDYWNSVQSLVLRGCLEDAWALLSRHLLCRRCFEVLTESSMILDDLDRTKLCYEGFSVLRALLLCAPLAGGRNDFYDDGLTLLSNDDDEIEEEEQQDQESVFLEGIPTDAYGLWEQATGSSSSRITSDRPLEYNAYAATTTFRAWRRAVNDHMETTLAPLIQQLPQIQSHVLNILSGQFENITFQSWSDAFCAELLYQRPELSPRDFYPRIKRVMEKYGAISPLENALLSVMQNNAGRVVSLLHDFGGFSGAALPATMTALLCNLLTEAGELSKAEPPAVCIQTELLLAASEAIRSSLTNESDLAVRLSTKLLLPHATPENDVRIVAMLAETISTHAPKTDAEVRTLLSLCGPLVTRKSRRVLDACTDLVLVRHADTLPSGRAVHWLLRGLELELELFCDGRKEPSAWQTVLASGRCGMILRTECITTAKALLVGLCDDTPEGNVGIHYVKASDMVSSIQNDDNLADFCQMIPDIQLLIYVQGMAQDVVENKGDRAVGEKITACLEDNVRADDGSVACVAHPSMQWDFLLLACAILKRDQEQQSNASFDVHGMQCLLERFAQLELSGKARAGDMNSMRLALGNGLARAIVTENAKKKEFGLQFAPTQPRVGTVLSTQLSSYSRSEQEAIVRAMLEPSM